MMWVKISYLKAEITDVTQASGDVPSQTGFAVSGLSRLPPSPSTDATALFPLEFIASSCNSFAYISPGVKSPQDLRIESPVHVS